MKIKRFPLLILLAAGVTAVQAANPFTDVAPTDWSYQAVERLASDGIIDGYPDGTFRGGRNLTRYELAQLTARAMVHEDRLDDEQKASLDRLTKEYGAELKNLGVRVGNLENAVANRLQIGGTARFAMSNDRGSVYDKDHDRFEGRLQLRMIGNVSERTKAIALIEKTQAFNGPKGSSDDDLSLKYGFIKHDFNFGSAVIGKFPVNVGVTGVHYNDTFAGVGLTFGQNEGLSSTFLYGNVQNIDMDFIGPMLGFYKIVTDIPSTRGHYEGKFKPETWYLDIKYRKPLKLLAKAFTLQPSGKTGELVELYGAGLVWFPHKFINIHGDYVINNKNNKVNPNRKPKMWVAGLAFGLAHPHYPKSFQVSADYVYSDAGSYFGQSNYDILQSYLAGMKNIPDDQLSPEFLAGITKTPEKGGVAPSYLKDMVDDIRDGDGNSYSFRHGGARFWLFSARYVPTKNVLMEAFYVTDAEALNGEKIEDSYRVQMTCFF